MAKGLRTGKSPMYILSEIGVIVFCSVGISVPIDTYPGVNSIKHNGTHTLFSKHAQNGAARLLNTAANLGSDKWREPS